MSKHQKIKINELYWYCEDDIRDILRGLVGNRATIFAQTQMEHQDLLKDNFRNAVKEVLLNGNVALIPIHVNGNHWTSAIVRRKANGKIQVIYNDPIGNSIYSNANGGLLLSEIRGLVGDFDFIDVRLRQQMNGSDCGPFSVDNMVNLFEYVSDPNNNPDDLDREAIINANILSRPEGGNAREIRRQHAVLLPRLQNNSADLSTSTFDREQKILELTKISQEKSDKAFLSDVEKFLNLKDLISKINSLGDSEDEKYQVLAILKEIAEVAKSIYRKESDESNFRNKHAAYLNFLNCIEQLKFITSDDLGVFAKLEEFSDYKKELMALNTIIDYVLDQERVRFDALVSSNTEIRKRFPDKASMPKSNPDKFNYNGHLALFICSQYLPKAIQRIVEILSELEGLNLDFKILEDRYAFARLFAMAGELSRSIRNVLGSKVSEEFFKRLNKLRDAVKTSHFKTIANGVEGSDYSKFEDLFSQIENIKSRLNDLMDKMAVISYDQDYSNKLLSLLNTAITPVNEFKALEDFLEVKKSDTSKVKEALDKLQKIFEEQEKEYKTEGNYDISQYNAFYNALSDTEKKNFPVDGSFDSIKAFKVQKSSGKPSQEVIKILKFIKTIQKEYKTKEEIIAQKLKLTLCLQKEIKNYSTELSKIPEDDRIDKNGNPFPQATEDEIRNYLKSLAKSGARKKVTKNDPSNFSKYCRQFDEELERLNAVMEQSESDKKELAIAHSVGIMGEAIRFMLEIDEQDCSLSDLFNLDAIRDINNVRFVRNNQVMHGVFNYDADVVFRAAEQQALSWKVDVSALSRIHQFIKLHSQNADDLLSEVRKRNPQITKSQIQIRPLLFLADCYLRLGKYEELQKIISEFDEIYQKFSQEEKVEVVEEMAVISTFKSKIHINHGNIDKAEEEIELTLAIILSLGDDNLSDSLKKEKARLYNNLGYLQESKGHYEDAKRSFLNSLKSCNDNVLNLYAACQYASILFYQDKFQEGAIKIIEQSLVKITEINEKNIYEMILAIRQKMILERDMGKYDLAEETFKDYSELCQNIKLLKLSLGRNYKVVEAMFLQDVASEYYRNADYPNAIQYWQNSISVLEELGINNQVDSVGNCFLGIANSYKSLATTASSDLRNLYRNLALENYEKARKVANNAGMKDSLFMAHCLSGEAQVLQSMKKNCQKELDQAESLYQRFGSQGKFYGEKSSYNLKVISLGQQKRVTPYAKHMTEYDLGENNHYAAGIQLFFQKKEFYEARKQFKAHLEDLKREGVANPTYVSALKNIVICCIELKETKKALKYCQELEDFVGNHPYCTDGYFKEEINKVFMSSGKKTYKWKEFDKDAEPSFLLQGKRQFECMISESRFNEK